MDNYIICISVLLILVTIFIYVNMLNNPDKKNIDPKKVPTGYNAYVKFISKAKSENKVFIKILDTTPGNKVFGFSFAAKKDYYIPNQMNIELKVIEKLGAKITFKIGQFDDISINLKNRISNIKHETVGQVELGKTYNILGNVMRFSKNEVEESDTRQDYLLVVEAKVFHIHKGDYYEPDKYNKLVELIP